MEALQRVMDEVAVDARPPTDLFALLDAHSDALLALLSGKKSGGSWRARRVYGHRNTTKCVRK